MMNRVSVYIRQTLQDIYPSQELKHLVMMIWCDLLGMEALDIYLGKDINLSESKQQELENILMRMKKNEPIQYIQGIARFCGHSFEVLPGVLIPRPETEELVDVIVRECEQPNLRILDVGTGSGCIAISLSLQLLHSELTAWDLSDEAIAVARRNKEALGANICLVKQDLFDEIIGEESAYDVIVSNPPYVTQSEKQEMELNVLDWEPELALFVPDDDPLLYYRRLSTIGQQLLKPGGKLYLEINRAYGSATVHLLEDAGYKGLRLVKDQYGNDRIVIAYK